MNKHLNVLVNENVKLYNNHPVIHATITVVGFVAAFVVARVVAHKYYKSQLAQSNRTGQYAK